MKKSNTNLETAESLVEEGLEVRIREGLTGADLIGRQLVREA